MNVAIIGASDKQNRFAFKAQRMFAVHGHRVFPISPTGKGEL
ncbi:MAG: putative CoA-binding protein [Pseudoalteromonas tetraodonis]|jgi:predicted CoA-binding protein